MTERVWRVGQITDLHGRETLWGMPGHPVRRSRLLRELLMRALAVFRTRAVDFIAVTGDLLDVPNTLVYHDDYYDFQPQAVEQAAVVDYRLIKELLEASGIPYMVLPGNHDYEPALWQVFERTANVLNLPGLGTVVRFCDREQDGHMPRRLDRERRRWENALGEGSGPIQEKGRQIHLQHYLITPMLNEGYPHTYLEGHDLRQRMVASGQTILSISGHFHGGTPLIREGKCTFVTGTAACEFPHQVRLYEYAPDGTVQMEKVPLVEKPLVLTGIGTTPKGVVFLDRDGVLNTLPSYSTGPEEMTLIPGSARAITQLHEAGYAVVVVTNQSCIGYGYVTRQTVDGVHDRMCRLLRAEGGGLMIAGSEPDLIMYSMGTSHKPCAPQFADISDCKPAITLLEQARKILGLPRLEGWFVGDNVTDLETARNTGGGVRGILVRTGNGQNAETTLKASGQLPSLASYVVADLAEAVQKILAAAERE